MQWNDFVQRGAFSRELVSEKPIIGIYGMYQVGKSTLLNCLLEDYVALTGRGIATTALTSRFRYSAAFEVKYRAQNGKLAPTTLQEINTAGFVEKVKIDSGFHIEAKVPSPLLRICDIVDTPGFNANAQDTQAAMGVLEEIHLVIFVIPNRGLQQHEKAVLLDFFDRKIPVLLVMNCVDGRATSKWIPHSEENRMVLNSVEGWIASTGNKAKVFPCNFLLYWFYQRAYGKSVDYIERPEAIEHHIRYAMEDEAIPYSPQNAADASNVQDLIDYLNICIENYDALTHSWR